MSFVRDVALARPASGGRVTFVLYVADTRPASGAAKRGGRENTGGDFGAEVPVAGAICFSSRVRKCNRRSSPTWQRRRAQNAEVTGSNPVCGIEESGRGAGTTRFLKVKALNMMKARCSSPTGRGRGPRRREVWVRVPSAAIAAVAQLAEAASLRLASCGFESHLRQDGGPFVRLSAKRENVKRKPCLCDGSVGYFVSTGRVAGPCSIRPNIVP